MKSTSYIGAFVFALPIIVALNAHASRAKNEKPEALIYSSYKTHLLIQDQSIAIKKKAGALKLRSIQEMGSGPDIQLVFDDGNQGICSTITIYRAPDGTVGPKLVLDKNGNPIVATNSDNPYAVYELTEPSESYTREFWRVVKGIEKEFSLEFKNKQRKPSRYMAIPKDEEHSSIAYVAYFAGSGEFRGPEYAEIPWEWEFDLFVVGKYFVKIHTEGPSGSGIIGISVDIISAINWQKISGSIAGDDTAEQPDATDSDGIEDLFQAAELGNVAAQCNLGLMYAQGEGLPCDYAEAEKWLRNAAEQDDPRAQYNLGVLYLNGNGALKNDSLAVEWLKKSAEQGHVEAQKSLGSIYLRGNSVAKDEAEAAKWWRKAAEQGDPEAMFDLGVAYEYGNGVDQNYKAAANWYSKAAKRGDVPSQFHLGMLYLNGNGVNQDWAEATQLIRTAAELRFSEAQYIIGIMYARGDGVEQDQEKAVMWYRKAAEQGHEKAQEALRALGIDLEVR